MTFINVSIAVLYAISLTVSYLIIKHKYIEEMVKKQVITTASSREIKSMLRIVYIVLLLMGVLLSLISAIATVYMVIVVLLISAIMSYDVIKSLLFYYTLLLSRMINPGDFVIMARGLRGWVKRITPFFVELHGEHGEVIRIPNSLAINEPVRVPSRALPLILTIKFIGVQNVKLEELEKNVHDAVLYTKRFSVLMPKIKIRNVGVDYVEFEVIYGLNNYEASDNVIKLLASKLIPFALTNNIKVEIRREHSIIGKL